MKTYRIAHIGCGSRGQDHIGAVRRAAPRLELVGLCDIDHGRADASARAGGAVPRVYTDPAAMLADLRPDILSFCTQPDARLTLVELGIRHGVKAIVCEKPMALTLTEARKMCQAASAAGVPLIISHQHKYAQHWQRVRQIVADGRIGQVRTIHATSLGWMMHYATHLIDYAMWLNGYSPTVRVAGHVHGRDFMQNAHDARSHPSPGYFMGHLEFANGVRGIVECGTFTPEQAPGVPFWYNAGATVTGTHGVARVIVGKGWEAVTSDGQRLGSDEFAFRGTEDTVPLYLETADCIDDPTRLHACRAEIAYHGFEVMVAVCQSALEHRRIDLPLHDPSIDVFARLLAQVPA